MFRGSIYIVIMALTFLVACGGAASGPSTPTDIPIALEGVEGSTEVDVSSSFAYTFSKAVDVDTVTTDTFYMVTGDGDCDSDNALGASVECESETECILDPTDDLTESVQYTVCLDEGTASASISEIKADDSNGIFYADGTPFEGDSITFTTATEMTLTLCSEIYSSEECTWDGVSDPTEGETTFSYSSYAAVADYYGLSETEVICICQLSNADEYTGCMPYDTSYYETCGLDTSSGSGGSEYITWGSGLEDDEVVTLGNLNSTTVAFSTSVTLTPQDGEDTSSVTYWFGGQYAEAGGDNYSPIEQNPCGVGQLECSISATEAEIGSMITEQTGIDNANWTAGSRCVEFLLHWQLSGLDPDYHTDSDTSSEGTQDGSGQRTVYFQNMAGACSN